MKNKTLGIVGVLVLLCFGIILMASSSRDTVEYTYEVPITNGNVFFVDPVMGSNTYNGLTPKTAVQYIQTAIDRCSGKTHDYIILLPSSADYDDDPVSAATTDDGVRKRLTSAAIYLNKPYVHIIGKQPLYGAQVNLTPGTATTAGYFNIGASGDYCSIENVNMYTSANALLVLASGVANFTIKDCYFRGGTIGIDADAGDCTRLHISNCIFEDQSTYGVTMNSTKGSIYDCKFITPGSTSPTAFLYTTGNAPSVVGPRLYMNGNGSATTGYSNNNVAGVMLVDAFIIGCTDNVSIGSGGNTGIVWTISKDGGQGAVQIGYDGVADQNILIQG